MRLTQQTSYSIQTLMYCAMNQSGPSRIRDIAKAYRISELHLFKIMHVLVEAKLIETLRGRNGVFGWPAQRSPFTFRKSCAQRKVVLSSMTA